MIESTPEIFRPSAIPATCSYILDLQTEHTGLPSWKGKRNSEIDEQRTNYKGYPNARPIHMYLIFHLGQCKYHKFVNSRLSRFVTHFQFSDCLWKVILTLMFCNLWTELKSSLQDQKFLNKNSECIDAWSFRIGLNKMDDFP